MKAEAEVRVRYEAEVAAYEGDPDKDGPAARATYERLAALAWVLGTGDVPTRRERRLRGGNGQP